MSIYDSKLWNSDLDEIIKTLPELAMLSGQRVMITGCTGLIGSAVADVLIRWNETREGKIELLLAGRDKERVRDRFAPFFERDWLTFQPYDAASYENKLETRCDYVIHGAGNGAPGKIIAEPVETMISNFEGMRFLLDYARKHAVKRCIFISSSEVYGQGESDKPRKLGDYGGIDSLDPRSSYSIGKQAAETLCVSYFHEYGVPSSIIRPGHVYGPTATASDNRVSQAWAFNAARGEDIVMKSDGSQIRSYCYCLDCAAAILKVMLKGENAMAYNVSDPASIASIKDIATIMAKFSGVKVIMDLPTKEERKAFNPMRNSSLDATELWALGWRGLFDAERGFSHTIRILREA